ncbi:MAG: 4Fe-4S binding protein [Firmicutes bacterium]|nr:4Fe-4S binding protein [Bacillota bacterium]
MTRVSREKSMRFKLSKYRRIIQAFFLVLFLILLVIAARPITLPFPAQLFLSSDPLIALTAVLAGLPLVTALLYSLITLIVTFLFGRIFCGYACPMGTFIDLFSPLAKLLNIDQKAFRKLKTVPLAMLAIVLIMSALKVNILMILDPISLLTRTMTVTVFPALNFIITKASIGLYKSDALASGVDSTMKALNGVLVYSNGKSLDSSQWIILIFISVVSLNVLGKRFWCRYLCPLGGLLGLIGRIPLYRRKVEADACAGCLDCATVCEMDAVAGDGDATDTASCVLCLKCRDECPQDAISWGLKPELVMEMPSRRLALAAIGTSIATAYLVPLKAAAAEAKQTLIRPPGVSNEDEFLNKCVRCGECLKACPTNVLQPSLLQYGLEALWTPHLDFSRGSCDWSCNACGRVCPTGAIQNLTLKEKQKFVIGRAEIDRSRCYPWIAGHGCKVCYDLCPLPEKAVILKDTGRYDNSGIRIVLPYMVRDKCIGCGICESECPVPKKKAVYVFHPSVKNPYPNNKMMELHVNMQKS